MKVLNLGSDRMANTDKVSVVFPLDDSAKKFVDIMRDEGKLIDLTGGKVKRCVIVMDNGYVLLSNLRAEKIGERLIVALVEDPKD